MLSLLVFFVIALVCGVAAGVLLGYMPVFSSLFAVVIAFVAVSLLVLATPFDLGPFLPIGETGQPLGTALIAGVVAAVVVALIERLVNGKRDPYNARASRRR